MSTTQRHNRDAVINAIVQLQLIPDVLRPLVRAYVLGYATAVTPRLIALFLRQISSRRRKDAEAAVGSQSTSLLKSATRILRIASEPNRFPAFCAILAGGTTLLQIPLRQAVDRLAKGQSRLSRIRLSRWISSFLAAWFGLRLLQSSPESLHQTPRDGSKSTRSNDVAGRTMDLTLFAVTRAADVIIGELWSQYRIRRETATKWTKIEQLASEMADPLVFSTSCAFIMWSWFYFPEKLPKAYANWITTAAQVDKRLIEALRRCAKGDLRYGEETGQAPLLQSMCDDYQWPRQWGNPAVAVPFPCEMVHMGCGPSCEYHALSRFLRGWKWSMLTYLPISLALWARKPSRSGLRRAVLSATKSSAFLGAFIALFYYGVCLSRTRIGPHLIGKDAASRQKIDGGICVGTGCALCGWSVLFETMSRRKDMALFVAPRALATVVPRQYPADKQWRETLVFALSTAVVFTSVLENPNRVRGFLGRLLSGVMRQSSS